MRRVWTSALVMAGLWLASVSATAQADDDVGAATEAICCGANCCLIGGQCFQRGDRNPANNCQQCDPGATQTAFSAVASCGGADAGSGGGGDDGGCAVSPARAGAGSGALLAGLAIAVVGLTVLRSKRRR